MPEARLAPPPDSYRSLSADQGARTPPDGNLEEPGQQAPSVQPNCLVGLSSPAVFMCYIHTVLQVLAGSEIPLSLARVADLPPEPFFDVDDEDATSGFQDASELLGGFLYALSDAATTGLYPQSFFQGVMLYFTECTGCGFLKCRQSGFVNFTSPIEPADTDVHNPRSFFLEAVKPEELVTLDCRCCADRAFANRDSTQSNYQPEGIRYIEGEGA
ncbi:hypothetical protein B484DRAFT_410466, partial [Ochromonadaceae sp. CCMP2298]